MPQKERDKGDLSFILAIGLPLRKYKDTQQCINLRNIDEKLQDFFFSRLTSFVFELTRERELFETI